MLTMSSRFVTFGVRCGQRRFNPMPMSQSGATAAVPLEVPGEVPAEVISQAREELQAALLFHEARLADDPEPDDISIAAHRRSAEAHEEVVAALARIEEGSFGICESCLSPIPDARLEAMPHAARCTRCAAAK